METLLLKLAFLLAVVIDQPQIVLSQNTHYLEDSEQKWNTPEAAIEALAKDPDLAKKKADLSLGFRKHPVWFVTKLYNRSEEERYVLSFDFHNLERIDLWLLTQKGITQLPAQGHLNPLSQRSYFSRTANVELELPRGEEVYLLYSISSRSVIQGGTHLFTFKAFVEAEARENALFWWVYGAILGVGFFYGILGITAGRKMIRLYVGYILTTAALQFVISGHAYIYLPTHFPRSTEYIQTIAPFTLFMIARFSSRFLRLQYFQPFAYKLLIVSQGFSLTMCALILIGVIEPIYIWIQFASLVINTIVFVISLRAISLGQDEARYFGLSFGLFFLTIAIFISKNLAWLPATFWINAALPLGNAFQVILMGLALADRYRRMEQEKQALFEQKEAAQLRYNQEILEVNSRLETAVKEKTKDLRVLLENTDIGIFTIGAKGLIGQEYSTHLADILGRSDLAGQSVQDVLLKASHLSSEEQEKVTLGILYSLDAELFFFEANQHLLPQTLDLVFPDTEKHLELNWTPIMNDESKVDRILVSIRDVTELLHIRRRAQETERRYRYIAELLELGKERYQHFGSALQDSLARVERDFRSLVSAAVLDWEYLRSIQRELHTSKALGRVYHLADIIQAIHSAEHIICGPHSPSPKDLAQFEQGIAEIREIFALYTETAEKLFPSLEGRITQTEEMSPSCSLHELIAKLEPLMAEAARSQNKPRPQLQNDIPVSQEISSDFHRGLMRALPHLISNAMDHGIESVSERRAKGKSERGLLHFFIDPEGRMGLADDGQGLVLQKLEAKAHSMGRTHFSPEELLLLIFDQGFSTKDSVDHHAGRGIGVSAARAIIREHGSELSLVVRQKIETHVFFYFAIELPDPLLTCGQDTAPLE